MSTFATRTTDSGAVVICPSGRITMVTAPELRDALHALIHDGHTRVVVDFSEVEFIDSSGLSALISGLKVAREAGGDLRIAATNEQVTAILRATTLDRVLSLHDSAADAFA